MIINKGTKQFQTRSDKQNENWLNEEWIAIDDNSEFAQTIVNNYPNVTITVENDVVINVETDNSKIEQEKKQKEIAELKELLNKTDYKFMKFAEGFISEEEYAPIKAQRQEWRDRINELEGSN